jgi:hypothetical protein
MLSSGFACVISAQAVRLKSGTFVLSDAERTPQSVKPIYTAPIFW